VFTISELRKVKDLFGDFIKEIVPPTQYTKGNIYYGVNVSGTKGIEPIDQLDGFLVAKALQLGSNAKFFPYIAGKYGVLNVQSARRAPKTSRRLTRRDTEKKALLESIMRKMQINGAVLTTDTLWYSPRYWELFGDVIDKMGGEEAAKAYIDEAYGDCNGEELFGDIQKSTLGAFDSVFDENYLANWSCPQLYIPAEVAEALFLREQYGTDLKIGPTSEKMYDDVIQKFGMGILQFRQPLAVVDDGFVTEVAPYLGKQSEQRRITFDPNDRLLEFKIDNGFDNPSLKEAKTLLSLGKKLGLKWRTIGDLIELGGLQ